MKNLISNREAMAAHLTLHGWIVYTGKASFDEVPIYRLVHLESQESLSTRQGDPEVFRSRLGVIKSARGNAAFNDVPDAEWNRLVRRAVKLNLVEGIDGQESSARPSK